MRRTEKWYQRRLATYFGENFGLYENSAEFLPDPAPNQWLFDIPHYRIKLVCRDDGLVIVERLDIDGNSCLNAEDYYRLLKGRCKKFDAFYEDYIVELIGRVGLNLLISSGKLECCGFINNRKLYTLC